LGRGRETRSCHRKAGKEAQKKYVKKDTRPANLERMRREPPEQPGLEFGRGRGREKTRNTNGDDLTKTGRKQKMGGENRDNGMPPWGKRGKLGGDFGLILHKQGRTMGKVNVKGGENGKRVLQAR